MYGGSRRKLIGTSVYRDAERKMPENGESIQENFGTALEINISEFVYK